MAVSIFSTNSSGIKTLGEYFPEGDATRGSGMWIAYACSAAVARPNNFSGTPTVGNMTVASTGNFANAFSPPSTSNVQGQGWYYPFTVNTEDKAKVFQITAEYMSNLTQVGSSTQDSDVIFYIYDVDAGTFIEPSSFKFTSKSSITDVFTANFQTSATSTNYRLLLHVATTNPLVTATGFAFKASIQRSRYVFGTPITDWTAYTPTGSWSTNTTYTGFWRRVGDTLESKVKVFLSGAPNAANLTVNLPNGLTMDSVKIDTGGNQGGVGKAWIVSASSSYEGTVDTTTSTSVRIVALGSAGTYVNVPALVSNVIPATFANTDRVEFRYSVPITGWSSSVQVSDGYDARIIAARYYASTGASMGTLSGSFTDVTFNTKDTDTTNSFSGATYTVPSSGYYKFSGQIYTSGASTAGAVVQTKILLNGATNLSETIANQSSTSTAVGVVYTHGPFLLKAGDTVKLQAASSLTTPSYNNGTTQNYIQIEKLQAPTTISATEAVALSANVNTTATSFTNAAETVVTGYVTPNVDTHNAFNTTTGVYTAPVSGLYEVTGLIIFVSNSTGYRYTVIYKNGAVYQYGSLTNAVSTDSTGTMASALIPMLAGETISMAGFQNSGGALTTRAITRGTMLSIKRVK
jgi:hypothetical protein